MGARLEDLTLPKDGPVTAGLSLQDTSIEKR